MLSKIAKSKILLSCLVLNNTFPMFFDNISSKKPIAVVSAILGYGESIVEYGEIEPDNQSKIFNILSLKSIGIVCVNTYIRDELLKVFHGNQYVVGSDIIAKFLGIIFIALQDNYDKDFPSKAIQYNLKKINKLLMDVDIFSRLSDGKLRPIRFTMERFIKNIKEHYWEVV